MNTTDLRKLTAALVSAFEISTKEAEIKAELILANISGEQINWVNVSDELPIPHDLHVPSAHYYTVRTDVWGEQRAMFLIKENGETGWYISYIAKLICPVTHWIKPIKIT